MPRDERKKIIAEIEKARGSRVIAYVTGDRAPIPAQIGDDAVRPLYQHVREIGSDSKVDFFLYSKGGAIDVPWRIVSVLRRACKRWDVLVPFRANSAATLIALGADNIVMGAQAELGPIDPSMGVRRFVPGPGGQGTFVQDQISVEDVMAYVRFIQERGGLKEENAMAGALSKLSDRVDPVALGSVYRTHTHIRDVARRILLSRPKQAKKTTIEKIVNTLAERVYAHGHAIGVTEAQKIGLPVQPADPDLDQLLWQLLQSYEQDLKLLRPIDPATAVGSQDRYLEEATIALIEGVNAVDEFVGQIEIRAKRQMPPTLEVSLNLNIQLPPGIDLQGIPPNVQQLLQQLVQAAQQAVLQQAQQAVQQALQSQAPLLAAEAAFRDGRWERKP